MIKKWILQLRSVAILILGNLLLAFAVATFILPHNVIMGGATGIGIVVGRLFCIDTALVVLVFNIIMLALGGIVLGKAFLLSTIASSLLYPLFLSLVQRIPEINNLTSNSLLSALLGGGMLGIGLGMIMQIGSSSGGTDVLNLVIHKLFHIPVSTAVYMVDIIIMGGQIFIGNIEGILYGIILLVAETYMLDQILVAGNTQYPLLVISEKYETLRWQFLTQLESGVTMLHIETGCICQEQKAILCVIPKRKIQPATKLISRIDPHAFTTITQIKEVQGQGFTKERYPFEKGVCMPPKE